MRLYISGKITGLPIEEAQANFKKIQENYEGMGAEVVNPMELVPYSPELTWEDYMIEDIKALFGCDTIYMMRNWKGSSGARIEHFIAAEKKLKIIYE